MRIAVLWNDIAGYLNGCLRALAQHSGTELFVAHRTPCVDAPYDTDQASWLSHSYRWDHSPDAALLSTSLEEFAPDALVVTSWEHAAYRRLCRSFGSRAVRVCCMDNQWRGTTKQWLGTVSSPWYVQSLFDVAFVPGERQAVFARRLGFEEENIWRGMLACDHLSFRRVYEQRNRESALPEGFLFVGRIDRSKGIDTLIKAYRQYRARHDGAWPLIVAGTGPLREEVEREPGINYRGFIQPRAVPDLFRAASCFVLPSRFEPWGVVLHEATSAGLPVICTSECGASVHLIQDGYNGFVVPPNKVDSLARAFTNISHLSAEELRRMADASASLSLQFSPERWSEYLINHITEYLGRRRQTCVRQLPLANVVGGSLEN